MMDLKSKWVAIHFLYGQIYIYKSAGTYNTQSNYYLIFRQTMERYYIKMNTEYVFREFSF